MGSMITLGIEKFEIDWGKNTIFNDHSCLFLPSDIEQIPYYYANNIVEIKEGLSRRLGSVRRRLDLLGYSYQNLEKKYQQAIKSMPEYYPDIQISFQQYDFIMSSIDLHKVEIDNDEYYDLGEYVSQYILKEPEISQYLPEEVTVDKDLGTFFENLDPYITLRILAENKKNENFLVQWRFADVVENGWVDRNEIIKQLPDQAKILIVTEGSSDTFIIERSLNCLYPDIADFFYFVDMEENYPFTGTGNLYKFCQDYQESIYKTMFLLFLITM